MSSLRPIIANPPDRRQTQIFAAHETAPRAVIGLLLETALSTLYLHECSFDSVPAPWRDRPAAFAGPDALGLDVLAPATVFNRAIPFSHRAENEQIVRPLAPGDHLQLLYHFWLGLDALGGHSPLFHNVYEFNLGDDSTRRQPDSITCPFPPPTPRSPANRPRRRLERGGAGLRSRRRARHRLSGATLQPVALGLAAHHGARRRHALPLDYALRRLPTGFAMALPPWFAYGLDRAIRDRSPAGGLLAGLALLFSYTADLHVFYFTILIAPLWALISFHIANPLGEHGRTPS